MIRRSRNTSQRGFGALFTLLVVVVTLATTALSAAGLQMGAGTLPVAAFGQSQSAPTLRIVSEDGNRLAHIVITGDDMRNLPKGENRITLEVEGGNTTITGASSGVWKTSNGGRSFNLVKTGAGTLVLPNANNTGGRKEGTGTLILTSGVVYELRDMTPADFDRVSMPGASSSLIAARIRQLKRLTQENRPNAASKSQASTLLLIGPAKGIAQVKGWRPETIGKPKAGTKVECTKEGVCFCSGVDDCLKLITSSACKSDMTCDGETNCYCETN
jgi:hypothetical protein